MVPVWRRQNETWNRVTKGCSEILLSCRNRYNCKPLLFWSATMIQQKSCQFKNHRTIKLSLCHQLTQKIQAPLILTTTRMPFVTVLQQIHCPLELSWVELLRAANGSLWKWLSRRFRNTDRLSVGSIPLMNRSAAPRSAILTTSIFVTSFSPFILCRLKVR